jgi:hypothetical protein
MPKNNFTYQKTLETYKSKNEIEEALFYLKKLDLSPSSIKFLEFFRPTLGATQAKLETIWTAVGISKTTYYDTVLPDLREKAGGAIVGFLKTMKNSQKGNKKVKGSEYKILAPLSKIKKLVADYLKKKEEEFRAAAAALFQDDAEEAAAACGNDTGDETGNSEKVETPSESKDEEPFSPEQKRSFREDLSKDLKTIFNITGGAYKIKKSIQEYIFKFPIAAFKNFTTWSQSKQYEIANALQLAIIKTKSDIKDTATKFIIKGAIAACFEKYEEKPQKELVKLLYTYIFNAIKPAENIVTEDQEDPSEDLEDQEDQLIDPAVAAALAAEKKAQAEKDRQEIERLLRELRLDGPSQGSSQGPGHKKRGPAFLPNGEKSPEFEAFCLQESDDLPF